MKQNDFCPRILGLANLSMKCDSRIHVSSGSKGLRNFSSLAFFLRKLLEGMQPNAVMSQKREDMRS